MTRAEKALDDLSRWYSVGALSWPAFIACVDNVLRAESGGWGWERV